MKATLALPVTSSVLNQGISSDNLTESIEPQTKRKLLPVFHLTLCFPKKISQVVNGWELWKAKLTETDILSLYSIISIVI